MRDVEAFASCQTADIIFLTLRELVALRDFRNDVAHRIVESQLETQHLERHVQQVVVDSRLDAVGSPIALEIGRHGTYAYCRSDPYIR